MNELRSAPSASITKISPLLDKIAQTCDALYTALDMTKEQAAQYGGGILADFDSELVDVVIKIIVQLRLYTAKLHKELANGLIASEQELGLFVQSMQELSDQLSTLMLQDGRLRNNFAFALQEIQDAITQMMLELEIK